MKKAKQSAVRRALGKVGFMNNVSYANVTITGGIWKQKQTLLRKTTAMAIYHRFKETGRIDAFRCDWKEGMPRRPHVFWDSDVAKWIEGVAYLTKKKKDKSLETLADEIIDHIVANQWDDGYFNIYYTVVEPGKRFTNRDNHELYCAGHLIEAGVAYYEATGKRKFLDAMCRYADCIDRHFRIDGDAAFTTPGHEEIELALVRLYECTGEKRYLALAEFFVYRRGQGYEKLDNEGKTPPKYYQGHCPACEQTEAVGHAVRAVYFYSGMADIALKTGAADLQNACQKLFEDITERKMYITGGIGSSSCGEAFTMAYDLPNLIAYAESCAALGMALFSERMMKFGAHAKYADVIERIIYNGFLSSLSLDGKAFFYENPLEIQPRLHERDADRPNSSRAIHWPAMQRSEVFDCSCCPPNIFRFIASVGNLIYSEEAGTVYVNQFVPSRAEIKTGGQTVCVTQKTRYPESGTVHITVTGGDIRLSVRIPGWYDGVCPEKTENGYAVFDVKDGETVTMRFDMKPRLMEARPEVSFDCGRYAVMRGPVVYCMESIDNGENLRDIRLDGRAAFTYGLHEPLGVPCLTVNAYRRRPDPNAPLYRVRHDSFEKFRAVLIPYYAFANREACEMQVWTCVK